MCSELLKVNAEKQISNQKKNKNGHVKNSSGNALTFAEAVITHLGLDMLGNVSIDSYLMMDYVLK